LFVKSNFLDSWRLEALAMEALAGLVVISDKTGQSMHAAVFRSAIESRVADALFACFVLRHRPEMDAPAGCKARLTLAFGQSSVFSEHLSKPFPVAICRKP
jgi:hypothetical protein